MWAKFWAWLKSLFAPKDKPAPVEPVPTPEDPNPKPPMLDNEFGLGYKVDPPDPTDYPFREYAKVMPLEYMPNLVDHTQFHGPVVSQGATGSCVGQSVRSAYEYLARAFWKDQTFRASSMYPYYNARSLEGTRILDNGTYLRLGVKGAEKYGNCSMSVWPFDAAKINVKPPTAAFTEGSKREIRDYLRCENLDEVKAALAQDWPVIVGFGVYNTTSSTKARTTGVIDVPQPGAPRQGGHAVCLVGYDDYKELVKFKNSWGDGWGDDGYGYLPYEYFDDYVHDMWTIRPKVEVDPTENK